MPVPAEVSVTGFDDIKLAPSSNARLTTIGQPHSNRGRIAAQRALKRIQEIGEFTERIKVEAELVVRESAKSIGRDPRPAAPKKRGTVREVRGATP